MTDLEFSARVIGLWNFRDPAVSQTRFAEAAGAEPDPAYRQSLLTQMARAQGLQEKYDDGHATLDSLGDPAELADEPGVRSLLERGRLYNSSGAPETAIPLFERAYERAAAAGLAGLATDAAHMLAIALPKEQHEEWAERGMAIAENSKDPLAIRMRAALLNNLGWTYADGGRWADALVLFERAVDARRETGDGYTYHVARWTRARALRALGRHEEALAELRELAATEEGADDHYVAEEIAENEKALAS
ncbi:MAG TPA: tetratricopeptide repeat protein [Micromonosporaceae bacterium]|nr:tetratricopeptide repeat protein [Micromonosporaceae bacterium]